MYPIVWHNDALYAQEKVMFPPHDRSTQFGDGVYEVIRLYAKNGEVTYHLLEGHMDRLFRSLREIHIPSPFTREELKERLYNLARVNEVQEDAFVYLQISRGIQVRNHTYEEGLEPQIYGYITPKPRPMKEMEEGVSALLRPDIRWSRCDIKSLNLLPNILAKQEAKEKGCYEAILHRGNTVTEGSASNVFMVKEGVIFTHPATNQILNGIVRQHLLRLATDLHFSVQEKSFTLTDLLEADEVFITSTTAEIIPIREIVGFKKYSKTWTVSQTLQISFAQGK